MKLLTKNKTNSVDLLHEVSLDNLFVFSRKKFYIFKKINKLTDYFFIRLRRKSLFI